MHRSGASEPALLDRLRSSAVQEFMRIVSRHGRNQLDGSKRRANSVARLSKPARWARLVLALGNLHRRLLAYVFYIIGPKLSYRITGWGAAAIYRLLDPLRMRSEAQCAAALEGQVAVEDVPRIARQSFVNRSRNLTDLLLASRLLRANTFERFGGRLGEPIRSQLLDAQAQRRPTILVTAYYGSFDLLPIFLGYNGIRAAVVYLPHRNTGFDAHRLRIRAQSGCEMVPVDKASARLSEVLAEGGTVAILADHHIEKRGIPTTFLGLKTKVSRSVGLLAWRFEADIVVAGIRRLHDTFHFDMAVTDVITRNELAAQGDPVVYATDRYLRALERMILQDPTQYLWGYARWGEDYARQIVADSDVDQRVTPDPDRGSTSPGSTSTDSTSPGSTAAGRVGDGETEIKR